MNSDTQNEFKLDPHDIEPDASQLTSIVPNTLKVGLLALAFSIISNPEITVDYQIKSNDNTLSMPSEQLNFLYEEENISDPIIELETITTIKANIISVSKFNNRFTYMAAYSTDLI